MADLIDDPELEALGQLAEEFLTRWRLGDQPSVADYAEQHPELADGIRALFPTLILMERSKPNRSSWTADDTRDDSLSHNLLPWRLGEYELVPQTGSRRNGDRIRSKDEGRWIGVWPSRSYPAQPPTMTALASVSFARQGPSRNCGTLISSRSTPSASKTACSST